MNRQLGAFLFLLVLFCLYIFSPCFLLYKDTPARADAVMLMIGHNTSKRMAGAEALVEKGYASLILIPARDKVLRYELAHHLFQDNQYSLAPESIRSLMARMKTDFPFYPENTDIEFRIGLALMKKLHLDSAIVVSSPYHMRRIRMIALHYSRGAGMRFLFVPAGGGQGFDPLWIFDVRQIKWILTEYAKILWFSAYSRFVRADVHSKE